MEIAEGVYVCVCARARARVLQNYTLNSSHNF